MSPFATIRTVRSRNLRKLTTASEVHDSRKRRRWRRLLVFSPQKGPSPRARDATIFALTLLPHTLHTILPHKQLRRNTMNVTTRALYFPTDTEYIAAIGADYPDAGIANWEEARCLFSDHGYNILDIRSEVEIDQIGNPPRSPRPPRARRQVLRGPADFRQVAVRLGGGQEGDEEHGEERGFIRKVEELFPDKANAKIIVACSTGTATRPGARGAGRRGLRQHRRPRAGSACGAAPEPQILSQPPVTSGGAARFG